MEHGLKDTAFYDQKHSNTLHSCHNFPAGSQQAARGARVCETSLLRCWWFETPSRSLWRHCNACEVSVPFLPNHSWHLHNNYRVHSLWDRDIPDFINFWSCYAVFYTFPGLWLVKQFLHICYICGEKPYCHCMNELGVYPIEYTYFLCVLYCGYYMYMYIIRSDLCDQFTHILQGSFTGTGTWLYCSSTSEVTLNDNGKISWYHNDTQRKMIVKKIKIGVHL